MKLAALGVVTAGVGVALDVPGLIGIGLFWVVMGLVARSYAPKIKGRKDVDVRTFTLGTLLWLGLGIPSLAVGLLEIGIGVEHTSWRWLPIVVGGYALVIGVVGGVLYFAGTAILAVEEKEGASRIPATLRIRAVRETGTYVNERPRLEFEFLVEPDPTTGVASYQVTKKATVPFTSLASLGVGDGFKAMVAGPEDPTSMEILWDQPVGGSGALDVTARLEELDRLHRDSTISDEEYDAQRQRILDSL